VGELVAVFGAGLASAASPCLLPLYPGFLAYLAANASGVQARRASGLLGLLVLAGLLTTMTVLGAVFFLVSIPVGLVASLLIPVIDATLIVLGVLLLAGRNPFNRLPGVRTPSVTNPYAQAYVYGVMLGPIALPCAGPFFAALLAVSVGIGDAVFRVGTFAVFGLGFGLPLVVLSLLATARQRAIVRFVVERHRPVEVLAGLVLVAVALYDLRENWDGILFTIGILR
jgi:cytochrome c-type biogenesis protein